MTLEKVAKAIENTLAEVISDAVQNYGDFSGPYPSDFEAAARAAVEALREPSEEMVRAGFTAKMMTDRFDFDTISPPPTVFIWQAMIDSILNTDTGEG